MGGFNIKSSLTLLAHRICKLLGIQIFYESRYGVKVLNRKAEKDITNIEKSIMINPAQVLFFVDGLNDSYSVTGTAIINGPHYNLVKGILEDDLLSCKDYLDRELLGALDGRFPLKVNDSTIIMHKNSTIKNRYSLDNNKYKHPLITCFNGSYYALDGKHRLSVAAYLNKEIVCDIIPLEEVLSSHYINAIYKKMRYSKREYKRNLGLLSNMYDSINNL